MESNPSYQESRVSVYQEKRKAVRIDKSLPVTLLDRSKKLLDLESRLTDISRKGLGFATSSAHVPGDTILFRLNIPGEGLVAGEAVLRWCQPDNDHSRYFSGAEIRSFNWGHASKLHRYLGMNGGGSLSYMDIFLMAACVVLAMLILQGRYFTIGTALGQQYLVDVFTWLPQAGIAAVSLFGIFLLFRHK